VLDGNFHLVIEILAQVLGSSLVNDNLGETFQMENVPFNKL